MSTRESRFRFGDGVEFGAFSQPHFSMLAKSEDVKPLAVRVFFAALGRMNRTGHAEFRDGELQALLQRVDIKTGEVVRPVKSSVSDAIGEAKKHGYIGTESNARCIVIPHWVAQKGYGSGKPCRVHG